jgi:hypothetical protein
VTKSQAYRRRPWQDIQADLKFMGSIIHKTANERLSNCVRLDPRSSSKLNGRGHALVQREGAIKEAGSSHHASVVTPGIDRNNEYGKDNCQRDGPLGHFE